jgi:hypothetical protein
VAAAASGEVLLRAATPAVVAGRQDGHLTVHVQQFGVGNGPPQGYQD